MAHKRNMVASGQCEASIVPQLSGDQEDWGREGSVYDNGPRNYILDNGTRSYAPTCPLFLHEDGIIKKASTIGKGIAQNLEGGLDDARPIPALAKPQW